jgi:hypothetical protein
MFQRQPPKNTQQGRPNHKNSDRLSQLIAANRRNHGEEKQAHHCSLSNVILRQLLRIDLEAHVDLL